MPTYLIERHIPGAGKLSADELRVIAQKSNEIIAGLPVKWQHSYVLDDHIYCVFESESVEAIVEHARCMGVPAAPISEVRTIISPATAAK